MKRPHFYSGNEALAHGLARAGCRFVCGYPGTPSTEIVENVAAIDGVHAQWCVNEKVALETAVGASLAGERTLVTMKHVGLNVAADPLMTLSLTGVNAGLVIVSADDPGMHSSQNEQDNRNYAKFAKIPMLEPASSQEAYDFVAEAFALSEEFDTPVLLRTTTRVSHGRGRVDDREPLEIARREYERAVQKFVMMPAFARDRNRVVLERLEALRRRSEESPLNVLEPGTLDLGIITSGISYSYCREAFPDAWFLKLGMSHPLPYAKVAELYANVSRVAVVEELDPFIEEQVRGLQLPVIGKQVIPAEGELNQNLIRDALAPLLEERPPRRRATAVIPAPAKLAGSPEACDLPVRPPVLCPGCSHRSVYQALKRHHLVGMGDIGCYTLGALAPLSGLDTCLCMGASIGTMAGFNLVSGRKAAVALIGDSTFFHSGITGLIDALYNRAEGLILILDNRTTAMTGHQGHPGTGRQAEGDLVPPVDIQRLCEAVGARCVTVDAYSYRELETAIRNELSEPGLGVIVTAAPCVLTVRERRGRAVVDEERCNLCGVCLKIGCPALIPAATTMTIGSVCNGCGLCANVCRRGALSLELAGEEGTCS